MNKANFSIDSVVELHDKEGKKGYWATGSLKLPEKMKNIQPTIYQILGNIPYTDKDLSDGKPLNFENDLFVLPEKFDTGCFLGSDIVGGTIFYGSSEVIRAIYEQINELVKTTFSHHVYDFEYLYNSLFVWDFENNKSMLIFYNHDSITFELNNEILEKPVISIAFGAHRDDQTLDNLLLQFVSKDLMNVKVKGSEDQEEFIYEEDEPTDADELVTYSNNEVPEDKRNLVIEMAHKILCEMLNYHKMSTSMAEENMMEDHKIMAKKLEKFSNK